MGQGHGQEIEGGIQEGDAHLIDIESGNLTKLQEYKINHHLKHLLNSCSKLPLNGGEEEED